MTRELKLVHPSGKIELYPFPVLSIYDACIQLELYNRENNTDFFGEYFEKGFKVEINPLGIVPKGIPKELQE